MADKVVPFPLSLAARSHGADGSAAASSGRRPLRASDPPGSAAEDLAQAFRRAYPSGLSVEGTGGRHVALSYHACRSFWVDGDESVAGRRLSGWLSSGAESRIGWMCFDEWHPPPGQPNDEFVWAMDEWTQESYDSAEVLADAWELDALAESGPILEFSRLWMRPDHAQGSVWAPVVEALIRRRYRDRFSVMVLKAFPLGYGHDPDDGARQEREFASRQRAMVRHYARLLGVRPLPGRHGDEGWMWRPLSDGAPPPLRRSPVRKRRA